MNIQIRLEQPGDHRTVEELTREAFWNLYVPGCSEHLLVHKLRSNPAFIPELNFVALKDDRSVGNIVFCYAAIKEDAGNQRAVITFGPVSVLPEFQKQGIGAALIQHALKTAADLGYTAVLIYGDPAYYPRFGFRSAKEFNIRTSEGKFLEALMALELSDGALASVSGCFFEGEAYNVDEEELVKFEKTFPHKEKFVTESQKRFLELSNPE